MRLNGAKILIVDDHVDLVANLREILEDEGAEVCHASTAAKAVDSIDKSYDIALIDINLPDDSGLSLIPKFNGIEGGVLEVLLITGNASIDDAIDAIKYGVFDYVLKPFDPEQLVINVARAVKQVRLRQEAATLHGALADSEASLRTLVDTVPALLLEFDGEGQVLRANRAVAQVFNLSSKKICGKIWHETFVHPADRSEVFDLLSRRIREQRQVAHESRIIAPGDDVNTRERWVNWRYSRIWLESGELRIYASGLDVTELRDLERRTRLSEKLAAVGTLAAGLAHEIRNPLNSASLQMQLLERRITRLGEEDKEKFVEPIHVVHDEIARLSRLVDDFLRFARPTEIRARTVEVVALVNLVVGFEKVAAKEAGVTLEWNPPDEAIEIQADAEKLRQVFVNLIHNAVEATPCGGQVSVVVEATMGGVRWYVRDSGSGIPESHKQRIFEPFFSTKESGTGLGMSICHSLVSLHGGDIMIHSGEGTTVEVVLPRYPPGTGAGNSSTTVAQNQSPSFDESNLH